MHTRHCAQQGPLLGARPPLPTPVPSAPLPALPLPAAFSHHQPAPAAAQQNADYHCARTPRRTARREQRRRRTGVSVHAAQAESAPVEVRAPSAGIRTHSTLFAVTPGHSRPQSAGWQESRPRERAHSLTLLASSQSSRHGPEPAAGLRSCGLATPLLAPCPILTARWRGQSERQRSISRMPHKSRRLAYIARSGRHPLLFVHCHSTIAPQYSPTLSIGLLPMPQVNVCVYVCV